MEASPEFSADCYNVSNTNQFTVDDLFDFPQEDNNIINNNNKAFTDGLFLDSSSGNATAVDSCNSSISGGDTTQFNGNLSGRSSTDVQFLGAELCVPYDDLAELEWLSNFVDESFSSDDMHSLQFIPTTAKPTSSATTIVSDDNINLNSLPIFPSEVSVPGKARSKRSRAAPCDWSSRLLLLSPPSSPPEKTHLKNINSNPIEINQIVIANNNHFKQIKKRRENIEASGRKCLHCASEKTPQWRTGPMGPKTLCNACGVRYKSGRLVSEYRPASSPTFVSAKHSNSHRKVLELRRQKEMQRVQSLEAARQLLSQNDMFGISNGGDDYLIDQPQQLNAHDFSLMI